MKHILSALFTAIALFANANENNMILGGYGMTNAVDCSWNIGVGALTLGYAEGASQNVMVGLRSGQNSVGLTRCVGIGINALRGEQGLYKATDINGQFKACAGNNTFSIYTGDTNSMPQMVYENGRLKINAHVEVAGGLSITNMSFVSTPETSGYDFYLDARFGDDTLDGKSPATAKKTMDGLMAALVDDDESSGISVCVRAGHYPMPPLNKLYGVQNSSLVGGDPYGLKFYGIDGADKTVFDGAGLEKPCIYGHSNPNDNNGNTQFYNITFQNFIIPREGIGNMGGAFFFAVFEKCVFRSAVTQINKFGTSLFSGCYLVDCKVEDSVSVKCMASSANHDYDSQAEAYYHYYNNVFAFSEIYGSIVNYTAIENEETGALPTIGGGNVFKDSFIKVNKSQWLTCGHVKPLSSSRYTVWGTYSHTDSCTFLINEVRNGTVSNYDTTNTNSLYGVNFDVPSSNAWVYTDSTYEDRTAYTQLTTYDKLASALGDKLVPTYNNLLWSYYGYDSLEERKIKNPLIEIILQAFDESGTAIPEPVRARMMMFASQPVTSPDPPTSVQLFNNGEVRPKFFRVCKAYEEEE